MNPYPSHENSDDAANDADLDFISRVVRYQDDTLSESELAEFENELLLDEAKQKYFILLQRQFIAVHQTLRYEAFASSDESFHQTASSGSKPSLLVRDASPEARLRRGFIWSSVSLLTVAALLLLAVSWELGRTHGLQRGIAKRESAQFPFDAAHFNLAAAMGVRFTGASQAKFFGELIPKEQSLLQPQRDYVLTDGLVELAFSTGATAIIEAPAVFRVLDRECLALDTGRCSVHAPEGAEGFRVETPMTKVVDRGTRFTVHVNEGIDTEVQVIEGAADVYWKKDVLVPSNPPSTNEVPSKPEPSQVRLERKDAQRFSASSVALSTPVKFNPKGYRRQLPDRVISYEATLNSEGGAENLLNVSVQRDGTVRKYNRDELITGELIYFKGYDEADPSGHLAGDPELPLTRANWLADSRLDTGVINPGGQKDALTSAPILRSLDGTETALTPGFAIRFQSPIVNRPGPDLVFFELQMISNAPGGDAFHVSPMAFKSGLKSFTIENYDLTLASPESLPLSGFYLYKFKQPLNSLNELETAECLRTRIRRGFRVLAVSIDLSRLGYQDHETVQELFFQDADDDRGRVDPVFIAGLPDQPPLQEITRPKGSK